MNAELFEPPFNLAGELLDESVTPEGEARVRALADAEARKAQTILDLKPKCSCGCSPCWNGLEQD